MVQTPQVLDEIDMPDDGMVAGTRRMEVDVLSLLPS